MTDSEEYARFRASFDAAFPPAPEPAPRYDDQYQRFHLLFSYAGKNGTASGDQALRAKSIEQAARLIMQERGIDRMLIRKRFHYGRPASEAEIIDREITLAECGA